ncbi:hypothetical protein EOL94_03440 [bacterium]|nr:hypothetical protein [bacterium]
MKKFLRTLIIVLIILIIFVLAGLSYIIIKNPLGLGDIIKDFVFSQEAEVNIDDYIDYDHPLLSEEQEERLVKSGVDIKRIPTEITPEQQQCGVDKLGEERILEIINGAEASPAEILKLMPCL